MHNAELCQNILTLVLCLDEGSVGMAGVGAAAFHVKMTVWVKPDKIHRTIRDLKLAEGHCCGNIFEKTKLGSAYFFDELQIIQFWSELHAEAELAEHLPQKHLWL